MQIDQQEITDLDQRRAALHEYLKSDEFKALPPDVQDWRRQQEAAMTQYATAMAEIKRLTPVEAVAEPVQGQQAPETANEAQQAPVQQRRVVQEPVQPAKTSKTADRKPTRAAKAPAKAKTVARKAGRK